MIVTRPPTVSLHATTLIGGIARDGAVCDCDGAGVISYTPPPLDLAVLPEMVLFADRDGADVIIYAATAEVVLPEMVLFSIVSVPELDTPLPVLPEMMLFLMLALPLFDKPPKEDPPLRVTF